MGAVELRIAGCSGSSVEVAEPQSVRRVEPSRLKRAEVVVVEDRLLSCEAGPGRGRDVVAEPPRRCRQPRAVVVDRPAEVVAGDEQAGALRPSRRARGDVRAERQSPESVRSRPQDVEVAVGDVGERRNADPRAAAPRAPRQAARSTAGSSSGESNPIPASPTSSGWPPLRRKAAGRPHASASSSAFEQGSSRLAARYTSCARKSSASGSREASGSTTGIRCELLPACGRRT